MTEGKDNRDFNEREIETELAKQRAKGKELDSNIERGERLKRFNYISDWNQYP